MEARNQPLKVAIEDGRLVISIGINTLRCAAELCDRFYDGASDTYTLTVNDEDAFASEVLRQLMREKEDGCTPVCDLLDEAFESAVDDGCEGIVITVPA